MTNQRPQIEALEVQNRTFSKENSKLRHQVQVRKNWKEFSMHNTSMESSTVQSQFSDTFGLRKNCH